MSHSGAAVQQWNLWKVATMSLLIVLSTAIITGVVVANYVGSEKPHPITLRRDAAVQRIAPGPAEADIEACHRYAGDVGRDKAAAYRSCMQRRGYSE